MKDYYFFDSHNYSENTPEYGHGEWPDSIYYFLGRVTAPTRRKAQNQLKRIHPELNLRFGGMFSPLSYTLHELGHLYKVISPDTDPRMSSWAVAVHLKGINTIY